MPEPGMATVLKVAKFKGSRIEAMVDEEPRVIVPLYVPVAEISSAPFCPPNPEPLIVIGIAELGTAESSSVAPGATVNFHVRQPRHERCDADLCPVETGLLNLCQFLFRLSKHFLGRGNAVQSLAQRNLLRPAHVGREGIFCRLRRFHGVHIVS